MSSITGDSGNQPYPGPWALQPSISWAMSALQGRRLGPGLTDRMVDLMGSLPVAPHEREPSKSPLRAPVVAHCCRWWRNSPDQGGVITPCCCGRVCPPRAHHDRVASPDHPRRKFSATPPVSTTPDPRGAPALLSRCSRLNRGGAQVCRRSDKTLESPGFAVPFRQTSLHTSCPHSLFYIWRPAKAGSTLMRLPTP